MKVIYVKKHKISDNVEYHFSLKTTEHSNSQIFSIVYTHDIKTIAHFAFSRNIKNLCILIIIKY